MDANLKLKSAYLRGVFDSQATVTLNSNNYERLIRVKIKNKKGLQEIQTPLSDLGIKSFIIHGPTLVISGYYNLKRFYEIVGFTIKRKMKKLKKLLSSFKTIRTPSEIIEPNFPLMKKLRKDDHTYKEIATILKISSATVYQRLLKIK